MTKREPKVRAIAPTPTALKFEDVASNELAISRLDWTSQARSLLDAMRASIQRYPESLPIRDLRLRLQVRDAGAMRVDRDLGLRAGNTLLATATEEPRATRCANAAVADWVLEAALSLTHIDREASGALRQLALNGKAVTGRRELAQVFKWHRQRPLGTAKRAIVTQFADLADYVAVQLSGKELYPGAGPLCRVVSADLTGNTASLMTAPITLYDKDHEVRFSLGITVRVATYPGRPLPVLIVSHHKHVWAREPKTGGKDTKGYAFPVNEARALVFNIQGSNLALGEDYTAIARQYNLPLQSTALELAAQGDSPKYCECPIYVSHQHGRAEKDAANRGVADMDRRQSFERACDILEPLGLTPWASIREIPTHYNQISDADSGWKYAFTDIERDDDEDEAIFQKRLTKAQQELHAWVDRMRGAIDAHYGGTHHIVIAYQNGLQQDAETAAKMLRELLGEHATVHLEAIPDDVHGPRRHLPHDGAKIIERALARAQAWSPFVKTTREYISKHPHAPVRGILVLARKWYENGNKPGVDDIINKRVARITLNRELGLAVQYLLPAERKLDRTISERSLRNFQTRVINAWRDLAWKSIGKMNGLDLKVERSFQHPSGANLKPVVLGLGVIRTNRRRGQQNETSMIPYAIELDTATGGCSAALFLRQGDNEPRSTPMLELPQAIKALTQNGPSHLTRGIQANAVWEEQKRRTQGFVYQIICERARVHPEIIILADMQTLGGLWPWLADTGLDPKNIDLGGNLHAEQDFPNATIVRLRDDHAPKVLTNAKRVQVCVDGEIRPAAMWSDANLYAVEDVAESVPTFFSFGSRIIKQPRGVSSYLTMDIGPGKESQPWLGAWSTPNALELTVIRSPRLHPEDVAKLVEALRSEYAHFGGWTKYPVPLFFASFLKEYVPDYELVDEDDIDEDDE